MTAHDLCIGCGAPVSAHRDGQNRSLTCDDLRLTPMNVRIGDRLVTVRTAADVYRVCARARRVA